jgi:hypothetical protein
MCGNQGGSLESGVCLGQLTICRSPTIARSDTVRLYSIKERIVTILSNLSLLPTPRRLELTGETFSLPDDGLIALDSPDAQALWFTALQATLARIDEIMTGLLHAKMQRDDADLIEQEFAWAADMLRHACRRGIWVLDKAGDTEDLRRRLADDAEALLAGYKSIWHARNRPGGFKDSYARLETMRGHYLTS